MTGKDKKSLKFSYFSGVFGGGMAGFTADYFTPFALLLGATARQVGFLNALPNFFAALIQMRSAEITDKIRSRKKMVSLFFILQSAVLLVICYFAWTGGVPVAVFIGAVVFHTAFGAIVNPAWGSMLADLVPDRKRGKYFGWRNKTLGLITVGTALMAGIILQGTKGGNVFYGFLVVFFLAFLFRVLSWFFLQKMEDVPLEVKEEDRFSMLDFIGRLKESNFAKFVLFVSMMSFSVNIGSPYLAVLMLEDLQFSYLLYTLINVAATLMVYLTMQRWGTHADKIGNLKIIRFTSVLISGIPLLWIINRSPVYLVGVQVFAGFLWAGFNLCTSNFIYDAVTPAKRTRCIAYFNVFNGVAISLGTLLGGFLVHYLPALLGYKILSLLLISAVVRMMVAMIMPAFLKEVRTVEAVDSNRLFFSMIGIRPILGVEEKTIRFHDEPGEG